MAEAASKKQHHLGTGRRKTSVARVRLHDGTGKIVINGRSLEEFFTEDKDRNAVVGPLMITEMRQSAGYDRQGSRWRHYGPGGARSAKAWRGL